MIVRLALTSSLAVLLVVAVGMLFGMHRPASTRSATANFGRAKAYLLPPAQGWKATDLPLASTEAASSAALKVLNFSDYAYREYRQGDVVFDVYVAHWARGRSPMSMVSAHTPDICGPGAGFQCIAEASGQPVGGIEGLSVRGETRVFQAAANTQWHLWYAYIAGDRISRGERFDTAERPVDRLAALWHELRAGSPEQLLIRISSPASFERLRDDAFFRSQMIHIDRLAMAGIRANANRIR